MFNPTGLSLENPIDVNDYKNEGTHLVGPFVNPPTFEKNWNFMIELYGQNSHTPPITHPRSFMEVAPIKLFF